MTETRTDATGRTGWPIDLYPRRRPLIFVISGPSGVGKDAIIEGLKKDASGDGEHPFHHVITATTRERRHTEIPDVHYHFLTPDEFARLRDAGDLLESANVYGYEYGTPR